jgi:hypothetical protein
VGVQVPSPHHFQITCTVHPICKSQRTLTYEQPVRFADGATNADRAQQIIKKPGALISPPDSDAAGKKTVTEESWTGILHVSCVARIPSKALVLSSL